jgi:hypothetical protein
MVRGSLWLKVTKFQNGPWNALVFVWGAGAQLLWRAASCCADQRGIGRGLHGLGRADEKTEEVHGKANKNAQNEAVFGGAFYSLTLPLVIGPGSSSQ